MSTINADRLWNIEEVAEYLKVSVNTLRYWRSIGKGPRCHRLGKHLRYRVDEVEDWVEAQADY